MNHKRIVRGLVMILVIALVVICIILACPPVSAAECRLEGMPQPTPWEPDEAEVAYISRTIWGECRGCCEAEQRAQAWCILNRVDDPRFPDSIRGVVTAAQQFQGYSPDNPVEPFSALAREIIILWHAGEREIPESMVFCEGDGKHQTFRTTWLKTAETEYWP